MISSELPEVLGMSDRVYVVAAGRIAGELPISEATQEKSCTWLRIEANGEKMSSSFSEQPCRVRCWNEQIYD
jgi:ABC-type dipeptide/oligopeptide/nickel transport system ATPase component